MQTQVTTSANIESVFAPALPEKRSTVLDALRGFALFGVLCANLLIFNYPLFFVAPLSLPSLSPIDRVAEWFLRVFVEGSFFPIFSFLFGVGFALQLSKGDGIVPLFRRRLSFLLLFGLVHGVFIWFGDILVTYALLGFVMLLFRKRSDRTILIWIVGLTLVSFFISLFVLGDTSEPIDPVLQEFFGDYTQMVRGNAAWTLLNLVNILAFGEQILALFLLGLIAGRHGLAQVTVEHRPLLKRVLGVSLLVAVPLTLLYGVNLARDQLSPWLTSANVLFGSPALGFAYLSSMALFLTRARPPSLVSPLAAVGRMALSNYLAQSIICTLIFFPYGLGLRGTIGPALGIVIALLIFTLQAVLSQLWLRHFRYGPAEWLWRALTYKTRPVLRR